MNRIWKGQIQGVTEGEVRGQVAPVTTLFSEAVSTEFEGNSSLNLVSSSFLQRRRSYGSRAREQGTAWFPKLENESMCFHFHCITSCPEAHSLFGRFFLTSFFLYSGGSDARLAHPRRMRFF